DPLAEYRIDEQRGPVELHQPAGMAEPGDTAGFSGGRRGAQALDVGNHRGDRGGARALAAPSPDAVEHRPAEHHRRGVGAAAVEVLEPGHLTNLNSTLPGAAPRALPGSCARPRRPAGSRVRSPPR